MDGSGSGSGSALELTDMVNVAVVVDAVILKSIGDRRETMQMIVSISIITIFYYCSSPKKNGGVFTFGFGVIIMKMKSIVHSSIITSKKNLFICKYYSIQCMYGFKY